MKKLLYIVLSVVVCTVLSCARMGSPDGGWYDERPPKVLRTVPDNRGTNIAGKKINIYFDEFIALDNATENVIISPPQVEAADIKNKGKSIQVVINDSLKANTTYTIDFSSAIKDNNEGNVMGNYTFAFSTGEAIDTLEVAGYVLDAQTLEPIESILVGLYLIDDSLTTDSDIVQQFHSEPMLRVARTDETGHYSIKGVKQGSYHIYALKDVDGNFFLTPQSGEQTAFYDDIITPYVIDDTRQDTTWKDSLHIESIQRVPYKHYLPDDIILRAFTEENTDRAYLKSDRSDPEKFTIYFTYGDSLLPEVRGLNFDFANNHLVEASAKNDTITYWLTDTTLVNTDSLQIELTYRMTDTLGELVSFTDTLMMLPKVSLEKRLKQQQNDYDEWFKKEKKKAKKGLDYDSIMPPKPVKLTTNAKGNLNPDQNITYEFATPIATIDTAKINLYIKRDTLWYNTRWLLRDKPEANIRSYEILAEWQPGSEYSLEVDSAAFIDIYGRASSPQKSGLKVKSLDEFGTLQVNMPTMKGKTIIAQLLDQSGKVTKEYLTTDGVARFWYLAERDYYFRIIVDRNDNGIWDTGLFDSLTQPEEIYYYPKEISCRAKWDITETWNPMAKALNEQVPAKLRKSTSSKNKNTKRNRNQLRANNLGIELPEELKNP